MSAYACHNLVCPHFFSELRTSLHFSVISNIYSIFYTSRLMLDILSANPEKYLLLDKYIKTGSINNCVQ